MNENNHFQYQHWQYWMLLYLTVVASSFVIATHSSYTTSYTSYTTSSSSSLGNAGKSFKWNYYHHHRLQQQLQHNYGLNVATLRGGSLDETSTISVTTANSTQFHNGTSSSSSPSTTTATTTTTTAFAYSAAPASSSSSSTTSTTTTTNDETMEQTTLQINTLDTLVSERTTDTLTVSESSSNSNKETEKTEILGKGLKVLFLSADTGGGHRASAESLANQFQRHYPGTTYDLCDVWTPTKVYPYHTLVKAYKHLSANPNHWRILYHISNTLPYEIFTDIHSRLTCYKKILQQLSQYDPDVVVSVHPTMNNVPMKVIRHLSQQRNKYIPFVTVVTDYGSAHCTWFQRSVDMIYVASKRMYKLARIRGFLPKKKVVMSGLPIRHDFAVQAEQMGGDRTTTRGKVYQSTMKLKLGLDTTKPMILLMGGGEGVGSLSEISEALYVEMKRKGVDATICVVCGRNEQLKEELATKDWDKLLESSSFGETRTNKKKFFKKRLAFWKKKSTTSTQEQQQDSYHDEESYSSTSPGDVNVVGLGFITNMAEYMVAANVLVSKAGPGTLAEAAAVGLPVMITTFLPGQEAGNVDVVLDAGFGQFCRKTKDIASGVTEWLQDSDILDDMSRNAAKEGVPYAASDIVKDIGRITQDWMEKNQQQAAMAIDE